MIARSEDGNVSFFSGSNHLSNLVFVPQVSGVEAKTVNSALDALQRQLVMEVDVRNQWNVYQVFDLAHGLGGLHVRDRAANYLATRLFQLMDLPNGGGHIPGIRFSHGLNGDVGSATDFYSTNGDLLGNSAFIH